MNVHLCYEGLFERNFIQFNRYTFKRNCGYLIKLSGVQLGYFTAEIVDFLHHVYLRHIKVYNYNDLVIPCPSGDCLNGVVIAFTEPGAILGQVILRRHINRVMVSSASFFV